jgi:glyoxylase-like metal-dependent hydrolase (beta-lactamase superfamily II)
MLEKISDDIFLVHGKNKGRFPFSHSILIASEENRYVLIDTGCGIEILKEIRSEYSIEAIINSHTHPDHSAGNWVFAEDSLPIHTPHEGIETAGNCVALSRRFVDPEPLSRYWRQWIKETMDFKDYEATHQYRDRSLFLFNSVRLLAIHTPGHTTDHYCFFEPERKILFAFDYDLTGFGPWYGHRESDIGEFTQSIETLISMDIEIFVSSHKGIITDGIDERLVAYKNFFKKNEQKILILIQEKSRQIDALIDEAPIYGGFPYAEPLLRYWEGQMIQKHLDDLVKLKIIKKGNNGIYSVT